MKKLFASLLGCLIVAWTASGAFAVVYGETGYVTEGYDEESAWEINSVETLIKMRDDINNGTVNMGKYYKLTADLDLTSYTEWEPIGKNWDYPFKGHFDGNGHTIKINFVRTDIKHTGLFGCCYKSAVKNISVTGNVRVAAVSSQSDLVAGGVVASIQGGIIDNCKFDGKVSVSGNYQYAYLYAGGIVAYVNAENYASTITNNSAGSKNAQTGMKALYSYEDNSRTYAGGIIGYIANWQNDTKVTGNYSKVTTYAGHIDTLTYGYKKYDRGTFSSNTEDEGETSSMYPSAVVYREKGYETEGYDEESAWLIDSVETLIKVRDDINNGTVNMGKYYKLTADLDLTSYTEWEPIGKNWDYPFKGHFDGNGHTIKINFVRTDIKHTGLFGCCYKSAVKNISVTGNVRVAAVSSQNDLVAGGVVASIQGGIIDNCKFDGKVSVSGNYQYAYLYAGGIVAYVNAENYASTITNNSAGSKNAQTGMKALYSYEDNSRTYAGGIIGYIANWKNETKVTGNYTRAVTEAGHTQTLTYGYKKYDRGTFSDNTEADPSAPDPEPVIVIPAPEITTASLPSAVKGSAYSAQISATGEGTITWALSSGILPDGLTFSSTGLLSGTPTETGTFTLTVKASNTGGDTKKSFTLTVSDTPITATAPTITTAQNLGAFTAGDNVSITLNASGTTPITWALTGGSLPAGLTLGNTGTISGVASTAGDFSFTVSATNTAGTDTRTFTIKISEAAIAPSITTAENLGSYNVGDKVSITLNASGTTPITWALTGGSLPSGLTLGNTGTISGVASTAGDFSFTLSVTNTAGTDTRTFTIKVAEAAIAPSITTAENLGSYNVGDNVSITLTASGTTPITWALTGGSLPSGLTLGNTGTISGVASTAGDFSFTVSATNTAGTDTRTFTIKVAEAAIAPSITTAENLGSYNVGDNVSITLNASGTTPITWALTGGSLPAGLTLGNTGTISGVASTAGDFSFTLSASNTAGTDTRTFTIKTRKAVAAPAITTASLPQATAGSSYRAELEASGTAPVKWTYTGSMVKGLQLAEDGTLSGTPSEAGTYTLTLKASNSAGSDTRTFTLTVRGKADESLTVPAITTKKLPEGFMNEEYSYQLEAEGEVETWSCSDGLPDGLELDTNTGEISGTIETSKAKTFKFTVTASNEAGSSKAKSFSLKVNSKSPSVKTEALKAAKWGTKYSATIKLANFKATAWSVTGDLPEGITFEKGKLSGKPLEVGDFEFTVSATNGAVEIQQDLILKVNGIPPKLKGSFKKGSECVAYSTTLKATGTTPIEWDFENLPEGLDFTPDATGETCTISGTPESAFDDKVLITLSNGSGDDDKIQKSLKLTIKAVKPKFKTKAKDVPAASTGQEYSYQLELSAGPAEVDWSYTGNMPNGLNLDDSGLIYGTPTEAGKFTFTVKAQHPTKTSLKSTLKITLTVNEGNSSLPVSTNSLPAEHEQEISQPVFVNGVAYYERGELTAEMISRAANSDEVIAAILPAVEVDEEGMYEFTVSLDVNVPVSGTLIWHSYPDGQYDDNDNDNAIFLDDNGETTEHVPASYSVTVSAWLEPGIIYEPVIAVKLSNAN